jgi:hypothetical protein
MPHDVSTWWNSTFDMLSFAIDNQKALKLITGDIELNLHKYELRRDE